MAFQPNVGDVLLIDDVPYHIGEHPAAPGMPYGQEGRQAIVYQLVAPGGEKRALKVFKPKFCNPSLVTLAGRLAAFGELPGMQVCHRGVLTPQRHPALLRQYPDLLYAVIMPWIEGPTWMEVMLAQDTPGWPSPTPAQCLVLARSFLEILAAMEQRGVAHCDLSGPNVLLPALAGGEGAALVDVEGLYGPGLDRPEPFASGTSGYAPRHAPEGLWQAKADRFAGAILIAEMLAWCDPAIRAAAYGETYFEQHEMQRDGRRYRVLLASLRQWGNGIVRLFEQVWWSDAIDGCASFGQWLLALPETAPDVDQGATETSEGRPDSELRKLGDDALSEYRASHWAAAIELLEAVIRRRPDCEIEGRAASAWLAEAKQRKEIERPPATATEAAQRYLWRARDVLRHDWERIPRQWRPWAGAGALILLAGLLILLWVATRPPEPPRDELRQRLNLAYRFAAAESWQEAVKLTTTLYRSYPQFETEQVGRLHIMAGSTLARQAERTRDPKMAQSWWDSVLQVAPDNEEAQRGGRLATQYIAGQDAWTARHYDAAIEAWEDVCALDCTYMGTKDDLYGAYIAYGQSLCAGAKPNLQAGATWCGKALALDPIRQEAQECRSKCRPAPTPTPTATRPVASLRGSMARKVQVRSGPGFGYLVVGEVVTQTKVIATGRNKDTTWLLADWVEAPNDLVLQKEAGVGEPRSGWIPAGDLIASESSLGALPELPAPLPLRSIIVADARQDYCGEQGYREWYYVYSSGRGNLTFQTLPWDLAGNRYYWLGAPGPMRISGAGGHPSISNDVARKWVSSYEGRLRIAGWVKNAEQFPIASYQVRARIVQNGKQLWSSDVYGIAGVANFSINADSKPGDEFYFILSAPGSEQKLSTEFAPVIIMQNEQGADGEAPATWFNCGLAKATPTPTPVPRCFQPRFRYPNDPFPTGAKGGVCEVFGVVYNLEGKAVMGLSEHLRMYIEGPPAPNQYRDWADVQNDGAYGHVNLMPDVYWVSLVGPSVLSGRLQVRFPSADKRALVDFYQYVCPP